MAHATPDVRDARRSEHGPLAAQHGVEDLSDLPAHGGGIDHADRGHVSSAERSVMAPTTRSAANPSRSGGSATLRWIQTARSPAEAAPATSQEFDDRNPSSAGPTPSRWDARR